MDWPISLAVLLIAAVSAVVLSCALAAAFLVLRRRATVADTQAMAFLKGADEGLQTAAVRLDALAGERADLPGNVDAAARPDKELKRALDDREFFLETLNDSPIRPLPLARMFPGIEGQCVEVGVIDPDTKHANHVDMLYVCAIARHIRARRIFEFGTYLGRTTYHLALGPDANEVFTLDLDPSTLYPDDLKIGRAVRAVHERGLQGYFFRDHQCSRRITQLHGDTRTFNYSPYHGRMDFVFVDGGHTYELISNDTKHAFSLLRPGGVIVWHDFAPKGRDVVAFARELSRTRPLFWVSDTSLLVYVDGINPMTYDAPVAVHDRSVIKGSPESHGALSPERQRAED